MKTPDLRLAALAALLLTGTVGSTALAQANGSHPTLREFDVDGDGAVSADEVAKAADQMFARADANGDGVISKDEFRAVQEQRFKAADVDGDGKITRADIAGRLPRLRDR